MKRQKFRDRIVKLIAAGYHITCRHELPVPICDEDGKERYTAFCMNARRDCYKAGEHAGIHWMEIEKAIVNFPVGTVPDLYGPSLFS